MKKTMTKAEMITAAENLYLASYKEFMYLKSEFGNEHTVTNTARTRWAALYEMIKGLGIDPTAIAVKKYDEIFAK